MFANGARRMFFLVLIATAGAEITDVIVEAEEEEEFPDVALCLADIVRWMNGTVFKMSIMGSSQNSSDFVSRFLTLVDVPRLVNSAESVADEGVDTRAPNDLVIVVSDVENASALLSDVLWNGRTRFILLRRSGWSPKDEFERFWKCKVANVFALVQGATNVSLLTFTPYTAGNCDEATVVLLDVCSKGRFHANGLSKITEEVRVKGMNGCPANVTVVDVKPNVMFRDDCACNASWDISGIEGRIMKEIARRLNMKARYVIALDGIGWGWIHPEPHGVVGEVFSGRSDFGIGLLAPTIERHDNLDLSVQVNGMECITYGLPRGAGRKQPTWITILVFEFQSITWALIVFAFLFVLAFLSATNRVLSLFPSNFDPVMYLFTSCLGAPIGVHDSFTLRLVVLLWIIFAFVITVAYRSSMGSKLTVPTPDPDIHTFRELLSSELQLNGYNNMLRLMQYNDSDADIKRMAERFVVTNFDINDAVDAIARYRKMAHVRHTTTFLYYILINPKAMGNIHLLSDCIYQYYPVFVMKKHSPFNARANQVITRLNEGGIIGYWRSKYIYSPPKKPNNFVKLSLNHTFGTFFIIILGCSISLAIFIIELLYSHISKSLARSKLLKRKEGRKRFIR